MTPRDNYQHNNKTTNSTITSSTSTRSTTTTTSTTTAGSSSITRTRACTSQEEIGEEIALYFENCIGVPINALVLRRIGEYLTHYELSPDVIKLAIEETALARYPSARYLLAILDQCVCDEVYTVVDWKTRKAEYNAEKRSGRMRRYY